MQIQRYIQKSDETVDYFGEHFTQDRWDFQWFFGDDRIGVKGQFSCEAESFLGGILVANDELVLFPEDENPRIKRKKEAYGVMRGMDAGLEEISELINLIQKNDTTHLFISSERVKGHSSILTFSPTAPSENYYEVGSILPVSVDGSYKYFQSLVRNKQS